MEKDSDSKPRIKGWRQTSRAIAMLQWRKNATFHPNRRGYDEKRRQPDGTEIGSDIYHPEASDYSHDIGNENDEDNKDPRPAKRRRPPSTGNALTLPDEPVAKDDHRSL
jgi:hypothetical protein